MIKQRELELLASKQLNMWNLDAVAALVPGPTFTLDLTDPTSHRYLLAWLRHADTIVGMNLPFDILWLRAFTPELALALSGRHTLIDLSVVNFLHSELRPERSLKSLGPVLGTHSYRDDATLKDGRRFVLRPGMSYQVADEAEPHLSSTSTGATLFFVD